jgi:serine/threonine protein phosphatase PrpC
MAGNAQLIGSQDMQKEYFASAEVMGGMGSFFAAIAHGIGSGAACAEAAAVAVNALKKQFLEDQGKIPGSGVIFASALAEANRRLKTLAHGNLVGVALIAAVARGGYLHAVSVGGLPLFLCRGGEIYRFAAGGGRSPAQKHLRLQKKDIVMLCSAGAADSLAEMDILDGLSAKCHPYDKCQRMARRIRKKKHACQENATIIVLENLPFLRGARDDAEKAEQRL